MYLLEAKGEEAFELMADLIDPISEIASDAKILHCIQTNQKMKAVKYAMKKHKKTLIKILAMCNGVPEEEYNRTAPEMLAELMAVTNNETVAGLFFSQAQRETGTGSGSATVSTEV